MLTHTVHTSPDHAQYTPWACQNLISMKEEEEEEEEEM